MKFSSTFQSNATRVPFAVGFNLFKSPPNSCPKFLPVRFILRRSFSLSSEGWASSRNYRYSKIARAGRTERDQETSTSPLETSRSQSLDDINDRDSSGNDASSTTSGEVSSRTADYDSSLRTVGLCVLSAVAFGVGLGFKDGVGKASEFFAGYLLEQSLSVDNLFVFVLIFKYFKVPLNYQNRVLSFGIAGAVIFRASLILLGTATLQRFEAVNLFLAAILLYSSFKLFAEEGEDTDLSDNFIVKSCQKVIPVTCNPVNKCPKSR
ncbi:hypothetical protein ACJIZ3_024192 [Penstemon smallii]|uniref:Uncharacterized protein n=1 Tax=Penstemon smallii TaxID=265156 RepID=A0ABD3TR43_9LAMI